MNQDPFRPIDPDFQKALPTVLLLLGLCLERVVPRHKADQILAEVLSDNREIAELTERQRLLVLRLCHMILDRIYRKQEEE